MTTDNHSSQTKCRSCGGLSILIGRSAVLLVLAFCSTYSDSLTLIQPDTFAKIDKPELIPERDGYRTARRVTTSVLVGLSIASLIFSYSEYLRARDASDVTKRLEEEYKRGGVYDSVASQYGEWQESYDASQSHGRRMRLGLGISVTLGVAIVPVQLLLSKKRWQRSSKGSNRRKFVITSEAWATD